MIVIGLGREVDASIIPSWRLSRIMTIPQHDEYAAVVVGAGSAGITAVGALLERKIAPILWVDDGFNGGRVNRLYREIPSNTQVWLMVAYAEAISVFRKILSGISSKDIWEDRGDDDSKGSAEDRLATMRGMDQLEYCQLGYAADMLLMFTEELMKFPVVTSQRGWVTGAELNEKAAPSQRWSVNIDGLAGNSTQYSVKTQRLVLCQGAHPIADDLPVHIPNIKPLDLDIALSPTRLSAMLGDMGPTTVGVIGSSHSAMLVLINLYKIASEQNPDLRVRWFTRHAIRYAVQMDGWILNDTCGLKGEAARWAAANLEPDTMPSSDVSKYITKVGYNRGEDEGTFDERLPGCKFYIQAIGYRNNEIPDIRSTDGKEIEPFFDHKQGCFHYVEEGDKPRGNESKIPGLYGCGIAWPERTQDPHGNVELAVGFLKFMKFVKREIPGWD